MSWERQVLVSLVGAAVGYGAAALAQWWGADREDESATMTLNPDIGEIDAEELAYVFMWIATAEEGEIGEG